MRSQIRYPALYAVLLVWLVFCQGVFGQQETSSPIARDSSDAKIIKGKPHSLFASAGYGSNMIWLGTTISGDMPFYSAALTYGFRGSLFLSVSASHVDNMKPFMAFYSLSGNYSHTFNKWFDISGDIAGYKAAGELQDTLFSDFGYLNLTLGFDWKILYTRVSVSGVLSEDSRGYIGITNSRYFQTGDFMKGNAFISFNPQFSILSGEIIEIKTSTGIKKYGQSPPFRHLKKSQTTTTDTITSRFGVMDFEFDLPVTFSYKNFNLEAEPGYILPAHKNSQYPTQQGFSFYLSAYVKIL